MGYARLERDAALPEGEVRVHRDAGHPRAATSRCARCWKRRPDVGSDAEYPDLSARDAAVDAPAPRALAPRRLPMATSRCPRRSGTRRAGPAAPPQQPSGLPARHRTGQTGRSRCRSCSPARAAPRGGAGRKSARGGQTWQAASSSWLRIRPRHREGGSVRIEGSNCRWGWYVRPVVCPVHFGRGAWEAGQEQHGPERMRPRLGAICLAAPGHPRGRGAQEQRHVAAQPAGQLRQMLGCQAQPPQFVQAHQSRRGIGRSAAQPAAGAGCAWSSSIVAPGTSRPSASSAGGAEGQVVVLRPAVGPGALQDDAAVVARRQMQAIVERDLGDEGVDRGSHPVAAGRPAG